AVEAGLIRGLCYHTHRRSALLAAWLGAHARRDIRSQRLSMTSSLSITRRAPKSGGAETSAAGQFPVSTAALDRIAQTILDTAKSGGATAAETDVSQAIGLSVTVRKGEVETIAYNRDKGIAVTVFIGQRRGHASTADFADESIRATVEKAIAIARFTAGDPVGGFADPPRLARDPTGPELYHPAP